MSCQKYIMHDVGGSNLLEAFFCRKIFPKPDYAQLKLAGKCMVVF